MKLPQTAENIYKTYMETLSINYYTITGWKLKKYAERWN